MTSSGIMKRRSSHCGTRTGQARRLSPRRSGRRTSFRWKIRKSWWTRPCTSARISTKSSHRTRKNNDNEKELPQESRGEKDRSEKSGSEKSREKGFREARGESRPGSSEKGSPPRIRAVLRGNSFRAPRAEGAAHRSPRRERCRGLLPRRHLRKRSADADHPERTLQGIQSPRPRHERL